MTPTCKDSHSLKMDPAFQRNHHFPELWEAVGPTLALWPPLICSWRLSWDRVIPASLSISPVTRSGSFCIRLHQMMSERGRKQSVLPRDPKIHSSGLGGDLGGRASISALNSPPYTHLLCHIFFFMGMKNTFLILKCFLKLETLFVYIIIFKVIFNSIIFNIQDLILCSSFSKDRWLKKHPR